MKIMPLRAYNEQFQPAMGARALDDGQAFARAAVLIRAQRGSGKKEGFENHRGLP
ncbi:hypothetical protein Dalk_2299 [Desulfatibacillum aliphaticivorans]|uniref:Uncharacterized protein n=1 Tax=Desulfatibacillum aliphaticivorans TaxID=218208 RepID=B8FIK2_DESAL|nr:hypothetical protein Dalk_2299 [Desulfatibacillum aliphaticivorans]